MGRGGPRKRSKGAGLALGIHSYSPPPVFSSEPHSFLPLPEFAPMTPPTLSSIFSFQKSQPIFIFKERNNLHLIFHFCLEWGASVAFTCSASLYLETASQFLWVPTLSPLLLGHKVRMALTTTTPRDGHMTFARPTSVSDSD